MKPRAFFYLLSVITLVLMAGGGYFYYTAAMNIRNSTKKLANTLAEIQVGAEKGAQLAKLAREYSQEVEQFIPLIEGALPAQKRQSQVARELRSTASSAGVSLGALAFDPSTTPSATSQTQKSGQLLAMPGTFTAEGSYASMQNFIQRLEGFSRQCDVTSITLTKGASGRVAGQFKVNFFLKP